MLNKKYRLDLKHLYEIQGLNLTGKLEKMNESQLEIYWQVLNSFTENLPKMEEELKNDLAAKNYVSFYDHIANMRDLLIQVNADDYANDCQKQINEFAYANHEKLEVQLDNLLVNVTTLSIDIQVEILQRQKEEREEVQCSVFSQKNVKKSILAVDDQALSLKTLKSFLKDSPYKLTCSASGEDALNYLQNNSPDLFILDMMMPGMDGDVLAGKIRECGQKAPIIFLTGSATKESVLKATMSGGVGFIVKPVNKEQVIRRITKYI